LLKPPILLLCIGLSDENAHTPNEKLDLDNLQHGMLSAAYLFEELVEAGRGKVEAALLTSRTARWEIHTGPLSALVRHGRSGSTSPHLQAD
jgi:hypothetical protein